ncbi:MAG: hypothetical protein HY364_00270 [Candidatus Aenigmarchaeota archaeon]|nr:hypothetical protein [Candidatus Aenigmarchaeota archaeon]
MNFGTMRFDPPFDYPLPQNLYHGVGNRNGQAPQNTVAVMADPPARHAQKIAKMFDQGIVPGNNNSENHYIHAQNDAQIHPIYLAPAPDSYYGMINLAVPKEEIQHLPHFLYPERALCGEGIGFGIFAPRIHPTEAVILDVPTGSIDYGGRSINNHFYVLELSQVITNSDYQPEYYGQEGKLLFTNRETMRAVDSVIENGLELHRQYADRMKEELTKLRVPFQVVPVDNALEMHKQYVETYNDAYFAALVK